VQVRAGHTSRGTDFTELVACCDFLTHLRIDAAQVTVHRHESTTVIDDHRAAIEKIIACIDDRAWRRRDDVRADGSGDIHPGVRIAGLVVEDSSQAKRTGAWPFDRRNETQSLRDLSRESSVHRTQMGLLTLHPGGILGRQIDMLGRHFQRLCPILFPFDGEAASQCARTATNLDGSGSW